MTDGSPLKGSVKLRSHMRGAVAELRRADFDIPAPLPRVCSHIRGVDAERICHFLRTKMVWSARFRSGRGKLGVGPISCGADFAPAPPPLRDRACVNTCNDLCWSQFSARLRPRMCEPTLTRKMFPFDDVIMTMEPTSALWYGGVSRHVCLLVRWWYIFYVYLKILWRNIR